MVFLKGLGSMACIDSDAGGRRCQRHEVEGMEFCLKHMPDSMLAEAEAVTGVRRCRRDGCREYADPGTEPPACKPHKPPSDAKVLRMVAGQAADRAAEIIKAHGDRLATADPVSNPYAELMAVTGELMEWKNILRERIAAIDLDHMRYAGKAGEQTRAEFLLYSQALRDCSSTLLAVGRLNLDARLVGIREKTVEMMDRALDLALEASGVPLEKKAEARETFRRNLKIVV